VTADPSAWAARAGPLALIIATLLMPDHTNKDISQERA
jgi:hypothetical protein